MKRLILPLILISGSVIAGDSLTKNEKNEVETLLAEAASKFIYLKNECGKDIDPDKFKELAKLKAFSEGYNNIEGISWSHVKVKAYEDFAILLKKAPKGELCKKYRNDIKGSYRFLNETGEAPMKIEVDIPKL